MKSDEIWYGKFVGFISFSSTDNDSYECVLITTFRYLSRTSIGIKLTYQEDRRSKDPKHYDLVSTNHILRKCLIVPEFCSHVEDDISEFKNFIVDEFFPLCSPFSGATDALDEDDDSDNDDSASDGSQIADVPNEQGDVDEEYY